MKFGIFLALILQISNLALAKEKKPMGKLETQHRLNGSAYLGKPNQPMVLDTLVEDDKYLNDLLGVRKDFKDKSQQDQKRVLK